MESEITIEVDDRDLQRKIRHALLALGATGQRGLLSAFGAYLKRDTADHFRAEIDPLDNPWEPSQKIRLVTKRRIANKGTETWVITKKGKRRRKWVGRTWEEYTTVSGKTLQDTGNLRRSIAYDVSQSEMTIGTDVYYGIFHQEGVPSHNLPQREFLGLGPENYERMDELTDRYLERVFR